MIFGVLKILKGQIFVQKLSVNYDCSILFSNFMAGDSVICNEYMSVWFVLGHGVKCCNLVLQSWISTLASEGDTNWNMMIEMKIVLFRDMKLCSLVEVHWCFRGSTPMMEAAVSSEMLVCFYHITWQYIPISWSLPLRTSDHRWWWKIFRYLANKEQ